MIRCEKRDVVVIAAIAALVLLAVLPAGVAAADLFTDDFGSGNLGKWTVGDDVTVITGGTYAPTWGGYYARFDAADATDETITVTIDASGYENIELSFARRTYNLGFGEYFYVLYDNDASGTPGTTLASYGNNNNPGWGTVTLSLPTSANNNNGFRIQFNLDEAADSGEYAFLDNVTVTGDPIPTADAGGQSWYLSTYNPGPYVMNKTSPSTTNCAELTVSTSGYIWRADEPATYNITFSGNWLVNLTLGSGTSTRTLQAEIGYWNATSGFTSEGTRTVDAQPNAMTSFVIVITDGEFTVPKNSYLALRLTQITNTLRIMPCASVIIAPSSDPGYPIPELATVGLFGVGLLALVGYVRYRKRT